MGKDFISVAEVRPDTKNSDLTVTFKKQSDLSLPHLLGSISLTALKGVSNTSVCT